MEREEDVTFHLNECVRWSAFLLALVCVRPVHAVDGNVFKAAVESIRATELEDHVTVLASDTFEGREAGTRGGRAAGIYLVEQLKKHTSLEGGGPDGGYYQEFGNGFRNILAILPGRDPELRDEFILVGAHYDHVGFGNWRNSQGPIGRIHNGADDNASGTSGLLETIDAFATMNPPPRRSILFAFWDAEEKGLLGSIHWVENPTIPREKVRLLINADMIGRLRDRGLEIYGVRTAGGLREFASRQNEGIGLTLDFSWEIQSDSDHYPFFTRQIPFLMLHTGKHDDYHRPSDDVDTLNFAGVQQISRFVFQLAYEAAHVDEFPGFRPAVHEESVTVQRQWETPLPALPSRFGIAWDRTLARERIVQLTHIAPGSPAAEAGLQVGDRIVEFSGHDVRQFEDFRVLVQTADSPAVARIERPGTEQPLVVSVPLAGDPHQLGISWRTDAAEPGCLIVRRVVPGTPANLAGLQVNDRIHSLSGHTFETSEEFLERFRAAESPLELEVERHGRIRRVRVTLVPPVEPDAAE